VVGITLQITATGVAVVAGYHGDPNTDQKEKLLKQASTVLMGVSVGALVGVAVAGAPAVLAVTSCGLMAMLISDVYGVVFDDIVRQFEKVAAMHHNIVDGCMEPHCKFGSGLTSPMKPDLPKRDPLVLDLNGDGICTINISNGVYFDYDGNGFAERTGWVDANDGFLAIDRNGNGFIDDGSELFGDQTILVDGSIASHGFQALADLDDNHDGIIDLNDTAYSELKVWKDGNADGVSVSDELSALSDLGIESINLNSTAENSTDPQGNILTRIGSYTRIDGSEEEIGNYSFERNSSFTEAVEQLDVPADIAVLPCVAGWGSVHKLHQAMVRDEGLKALVEAFVNATDPDDYDGMLEQILFTWTASDSISPFSRGPHIDARRLNVIERLFGEPLDSQYGKYPIYSAAIHLNEVYRSYYEYFYTKMMSKTHLKDVCAKIIYTWDEATQEIKGDLNAVIGELQNKINDDSEKGERMLAQFARMVRSSNSENTFDYLSFREAFIQQDPDLGWVFDTGGLPVYDGVRQGVRTWSPHIEGTDNADAVKGSLTEGDGGINGLHGNDVIYGTSRNERLYNESGDAILVAGGGNDTIWAGTGDDILDGGEGNDRLYGEVGNDTYIFRPGSGQDSIIDRDPTPDKMDTIWLGSDLTPEDIILRRTGNNLVLKIEGTSDSLTVKDFFRNDSVLNRVERIQFMDGTVWTDSDMILDAFAPTHGDDIIYGGSANDDLSGGAGGESITGYDDGSEPGRWHGFPSHALGFSKAA